MMDNEMLLARYLDGEMDEAELIGFESRLANEPALASRLEDWRRNDSLVASDLAAMLAAEPAPRMRMVTGAPPIDLAARRTAKAQAAGTRFHARRWAVPAALAASLAVVGLFTVPLLRQSQMGPLDALEQLPAGQSLALADGTEMTAVLTFAASDGRWCREYAIGGKGSGIACREDGKWRAQGELDGVGPIPADSGQGYATAGGEAPEALEEIYASLEAGDPLGTTEEAILIENEWTSRTD